MANRIPTLSDIYNKFKSSIFSYTKGLLEIEKDPFPFAMTKASTDMVGDIYTTFQDAISESFSQSATQLSFLKAIAFDRTRNQIELKQAEVSKGQIILSASASVDVPAGSLFLTSDNETYTSLVTRTCQNQSFFIDSIQRFSNFAIVTIPDHNLPTNFNLTISGAIEVDFNGLQEIQIVDKDTIKYPSAGVDQIATGDFVGSYFGAKIDIQSVNASSQVNKTFTDNITVATTIDFIEASQITFQGITGGRDEESLLSFKGRLVEFLGNPENKGNLFQHRSYIKQNTDANFVYFFQYEDPLYIYLIGVISKVDENFEFSNFSANELLEIKNKFIFDNQLLLGVDALNLSLTNPSFVDIDINITTLTPDTLEMRDAVNLVLKEYLALLSINYYLSPGKDEISNEKIKSIILLARDSGGNSADIVSVSVTGAGGLNSNTKKPILGVVTYA